jgi:hypothetical protein
MSGATSVHEDARSRLERRVVAAAEVALARSRSVSPIDVVTGIRWLPPHLVDEWRQGRIDYLEQHITARPENRLHALSFLRKWAERSGLQRMEVEYLAASRDRRPLRFTAGGDPAVELTYRTHWISPDLSDAARERVRQRQSKPPDLVVISPLNAWICNACGDTGPFLIMEGDGSICLTCADLDHLLFLPSGDAALTRRAKKASTLSAVVVRFSRARKRYERQGTLVEEAALEQAEEQCLADEEVRARRRERDRARRADEDLEFQAQLARAIQRLFPGCPPARAELVAGHAGLRGSGRVGRSAAGRALDEDAVMRAVVASIRHEDTGYDSLLMSGVARDQARAQVRPDIDRVLDTWRSGR